MNSLLDTISDLYNKPSPQINDPSELTKLIAPQDSPLYQYGLGGAIHNQLLSMINPHALGQPSMWDLMKMANNGDENARMAVAMNLGGAFAGMTEPVFHGTAAAPFPKFTNEAIGSGEGNQSFGYGHYLAGNPNIAKSYQTKLGGENGNILTAKIIPDENSFLDLDKTLAEQPDILSKLQNLPQEFKDSLAEHYDINGYDSPLDAPESFKGLHFIKNAQHYDVVDHPANLSQMLLNVGIKGNKYADASSRIKNEPISFDTTNPLEQQGLDILNSMRSSSGWEIEPKLKLQQLIDNYTQTYNNVPEKYISGGKENLANKISALKSININKLPSQGSTKNFVVFDPNDIEITHWNGIPVKEE